MKSLYEHEDYFSGENASGYEDYSVQERSLRLTFRRFLRKLKDMDRKAEKLLEVGCGYGFFLDEARGFYTHRTGTELSADAARAAEKNSGAVIYTGDISALPESVRDFDIIVMTNVIEHIYRPLPFLTSARQLLKDGGSIVVATPDVGSIWYRVMKRRWPSFKIPEHIAFYNRRTLGDLLRRAGFQSPGEVTFPHAFPAGIIARRLGMSAPEKLRAINIWLPRVMVALSGKK